MTKPSWRASRQVAVADKYRLPRPCSFSDGPRLRHRPRPSFRSVEERLHHRSGEEFGYFLFLRARWTKGKPCKTDPAQEREPLSSHGRQVTGRTELSNRSLFALFTVFTHQSSMCLSMLRRYLNLDGREENMGFHEMGSSGRRAETFYFQVENHPVLASENQEGAAWLGNGSFSVTLRDGRK